MKATLLYNNLEVLEMWIDEERTLEQLNKWVLKDGESFENTAIHTWVRLLIRGVNKSEMCRKIYHESGLHSLLQNPENVENVLKQFTVKIKI